MGSIVITIPDGEGNVPIKEGRKFQISLCPIISFLKKNKLDMRKLIHSIKVGIALVLVSLLFFLDPFYKEVGDNNAMWAIMTVVVIFEFYAGLLFIYC